MGFSGGTSGEKPTCKFRRHKRCGFHPWVGKIPGGGHSNPLQYSCLENPMDRGALRAMIYSVAKSQTRLRRLSRQVCRKQEIRLYWNRALWNQTGGNTAIVREILKLAKQNSMYLEKAKIPLRREWLSTPIFLPGESHGQRILAGYRKLGAGALGWPRGMVWGGRRERGSGLGTRVHYGGFMLMYGKTNTIL